MVNMIRHVRKSVETGRVALDPQVEVMLDQLRTLNIASQADLGVSGARELSELAAQMGRPSVPVAAVQDLVAGGHEAPIPLRVYTPTGTPPFPLAVSFHGGGFVIGSLDSHDDVSRRLATASGCVVVSVGYRLAPEHRFPAAVEDAYAATRWVAEHARELNGDPERIAVCGESAGGNLAAVVSLLARDRGGPRLAFQLLVYPPVDMAGDYPSRTLNGEGYLLSLEDMRWYQSNYLNDPSERADVRASPLGAPSHAHLPPALIITAEYDPLRDEGEAYGERLRAGGSRVKVSRYDGMVHGFFGMAGVLDRAAEAMDEAGSALRQALA
jgi:acetyl esterase